MTKDLANKLAIPKDVAQKRVGNRLGSLIKIAVKRIEFPNCPMPTKIVNSSPGLSISATHKMHMPERLIIALPIKKTVFGLKHDTMRPDNGQARMLLLTMAIVLFEKSPGRFFTSKLSM